MFSSAFYFSWVLYCYVHLLWVFLVLEFVRIYMYSFGFFFLHSSTFVIGRLMKYVFIIW